MLQNRGIYFHISWFFAYIRTADRQTGETYGTTGKGLDILHGLDQDFDVMEHPQSVIHILCTRESMNFRFQNINYNIVAGDYVILANMSLASGFSESDDYNAVTMGLSKQFVMSMERLREADGLKAAPVPRGNAGLPYDCTHPGSVRHPRTRPGCCNGLSECFTTGSTSCTGMSPTIPPLPPLCHSPLPLRDLQESLRHTGHLLDRPLHPA